MSLIQMSFTGAVLILVILGVRTLMIQRIPKRTFFFLWWLTILRLLTPISISFPWSAYSIAGQNKAVHQTMTQLSASTTVAALPELQPSSSVSVWWVVWIIGVVGCALYFAVTDWRSRRAFQMSLPVSNQFTVKWLKEHPLKRRISIRQSTQTVTPLTYGIIHPIILLPKDFDWDHPAQLQYVFYHELVHIRRFDTVSKMLFTVSLCIHWFNPLVWVMYLFINRDIELSCDECVVAQFGNGSMADYALTIISMEEKRSSLSSLHNHFSKNAVEERITAIMKTKQITSATAIFSVVLIVCITTVFATASPTPLPQVPTYGTQKATIELLQDSIVCEDQTIRFTLPEGAEVPWNIWISGRIELDGFGGMSVHYLEDSSVTRDWESGKTYSFSLHQAQYDQLMMTVFMEEQEKTIDLTGYLPAELLLP